MLAGIAEVVAPLGTALTEQQAALIRKYTKNVFLLYDSDQAGLKATFRSGDELLRARRRRARDLASRGRGSGHVRRQGGRRRLRARGRRVDRRVRAKDPDPRARRVVRRPAAKAQAIDKLLPTIRVDVGPADARSVHRANERGRRRLARRCSSASCRRAAAASAHAARDAARHRRRAAEETGSPAGAGRSGGPTSSGHGAFARSASSFECCCISAGTSRRSPNELARTLSPIRLPSDLQRADVAATPMFPSMSWRASLDDEAIEVLQELLNETGGIDRARGNGRREHQRAAARARSPTRMTRDRPACCRSPTSDEKDDLIREKTPVGRRDQGARPAAVEEFQSRRHRDPRPVPISPFWRARAPRRCRAVGRTGR